MKPIYFSKVEYVECLGYGHPRKVILLDLVNQELSYQELKWNREMPAVQKSDSYTINDKVHNYDYGMPARVIRSGKTSFEKQMLETDLWEPEVIFSWGTKLTDEQMEKLLPYCNALDFEPYRDKKMSMKDEGYIGYRDEISTYFTAITNSHIPKLELSMDYYYDEEHIWPSEKLYRYLIKTFFENNKQLKNSGLTYGGHSLFWG